MGIIDSTVHTLRCPKCDTSGSAKVLDKGSGWGGSCWQDGTNFNKCDISGNRSWRSYVLLREGGY